MYGVPSAVRVRRMGHGTSDHGLLRLLQWEQPSGPGLGTHALRALGSRWGAMLTRSVLTVQSHAESAEGQGAEISWVSSSRQDPAGPVERPFLDDLVPVREWRSGRLKYIHFDTAPVVDLRESSHLGALGHTAYTWRVSDLTSAHRNVVANGATKVTDPVDDGLGRRSFSFVDPSGYDWLYLSD